ncbi:MAG: hypothetical protein GXY12_09790 [Clostridiaceae bacterium]|jgi:hypothetical protein|nr:hypothetical protein [Clostridiaceae bacterium]
MTFEERVKALDRLIQEFLHKTNQNGMVKPKDVMPYLIEKGVYSSDNRNGNPLRRDLRRLKKMNRLGDIKVLADVPKKKNTYWYFKKIS